jgi:hypothetical protein
MIIRQILLTAIAFGLFILPVDAGSIPKLPDTKEQKEMRALIENALDDELQGHTLTFYWCPADVKMFAFFSPTQYKIIKIIEIKDNPSKTGLATVRINSSNKAGIPIIVDWTFWIGKNKNKYCIIDIHK